MNGRDLLEGMSFVDDRFVDEAETRFPEKTPALWRSWAPLAACVCLLVGCVFALFKLGGTFQMAGSKGEPGTIAGPQSNGPTLQETPSVCVRIDRWNENGFQATVTDTRTLNAVTVGMELTVVFCEDVLVSDLWTKPTPEMFPKGSVVEVSLQSASGSFDEETGTIYVAFIEGV